MALAEVRPALPVVLQNLEQRRPESLVEDFPRHLPPNEPAPDVGDIRSLPRDATFARTHSKEAGGGGGYGWWAITGSRSGIIYLRALRMHGPWASLSGLKMGGEGASKGRVRCSAALFLQETHDEEFGSPTARPKRILAVVKHTPVGLVHKTANAYRCTSPHANLQF